MIAACGRIARDRGASKTNQGQGEVSTQPLRAEFVVNDRVRMQRGERGECVERLAGEEREEFGAATQVGTRGQDRGQWAGRLAFKKSPCVCFSLCMFLHE